jgi:hypothetical protein
MSQTRLEKAFGEGVYQLFAAGDLEGLHDLVATQVEALKKECHTPFRTLRLQATRCLLEATLDLLNGQALQDDALSKVGYQGISKAIDMMWRLGDPQSVRDGLHWELTRARARAQAQLLRAQEAVFRAEAGALACAVRGDLSELQSWGDEMKFALDAEWRVLEQLRKLGGADDTRPVSPTAHTGRVYTPTNGWGAEDLTELDS